MARVTLEMKMKVRRVGEWLGRLALNQCIPGEQASSTSSLTPNPKMWRGSRRLWLRVVEKEL